jgi:hypothetical protein
MMDTAVLVAIVAILGVLVQREWAQRRAQAAFFAQLHAAGRELQQGLAGAAEIARQAASACHGLRAAEADLAGTTNELLARLRLAVDEARGAAAASAPAEPSSAAPLAPGVGQQIVAGALGAVHSIHQDLATRFALDPRLALSEAEKDQVVRGAVMPVVAILTPLSESQARTGAFILLGALLTAVLEYDIAGLRALGAGGAPAGGDQGSSAALPAPPGHE